jgi:flagellar biosynthesis component FlhA
MTKSFQILAGILAILGTLLIHNYPLPGFIFYAFAIASYFASMIAHRKEEQSKQNAENNRLQLELTKQQTEHSKITIEQNKLKLELFKQAQDAYKGRETVALQNAIRAFNIPESDKHTLYHDVILAGRGKPPKTNPFKK